MIDLDTLHAAAFKTELAASRRLMQQRGLPAFDALLQTLTVKAGQAGLAQLLAEREAARVHAATLAAKRRASAAAARARGAGTGHAGWRAWFDGSARPNPGRCGLGAVLEGPDGQRIELSRDGGYGNSSEAEYRALIALLAVALEHGASGLLVLGDSQVVIDDVNGPDCAGAPALRDLRGEALALLARLPQASVRWIPRHKNVQADALSQRATPPPSQEPSA